MVHLVRDGNFNNFSIKQVIARSTVNDPIFPKNGSRISLSLQITPPYSLFKKDRFWELSEAERLDILEANPTNGEQIIQETENANRFTNLEYHKWRFDAEWYTQLVGNLVLKANAKIGMLGFFDRDIGTSPFERFQLGGDGINNQQFGFAGVDIISLRGYEVDEVNLDNNNSKPVFDKFTIELRYPISLNPSSTIYVLAFAQGGNAWNSFRDFNPFDVRRSAGLGLRVFLPMFGVLGFDYGIGFDKAGERTLSNLGDFNIVLGFEPE